LKFDEITGPRTRRVLPDADDMARMKGSGDVQETQILRELTIELLFFLAKARKIVYFLLKHRDLNPIGSISDCEADSSRF
jgi:hypothetical protein